MLINKLYVGRYFHHCRCSVQTSKKLVSFNCCYNWTGIASWSLQLFINVIFYYKYKDGCNITNMNQGR